MKKSEAEKKWCPMLENQTDVCITDKCMAWCETFAAWDSGEPGTVRYVTPGEMKKIENKDEAEGRCGMVGR